MKGQCWFCCLMVALVLGSGLSALADQVVGNTRNTFDVVSDSPASGVLNQNVTMTYEGSTLSIPADAYAQDIFLDDVDFGSFSNVDIDIYIRHSTFVLDLTPLGNDRYDGSGQLTLDLRIDVWPFGRGFLQPITWERDIPVDPITTGSASAGSLALQGAPLHIAGDRIDDGTLVAAEQLDDLPGNQSATVGVTSVFKPDRDEDGVADDLEGWQPLAGLSNRYLPDSDGDGLGDGTEDANIDGTYDPDNGETAARLADTDGDGWEDGIEARAGSDPTDAGDPTGWTDADADGVPATLDPNEASPDGDGDGFADRYEVAALGAAAAGDAGVVPSLGDTNGDGATSNLDGLIAQSVFLGLVAPHAPGIQTRNADANRDGAVSNLDGLAVQSFFLGLVPRLPIGL